MLKSNKADFGVYSLVPLFFSIAHNDCHTETSSGAGIHPIKAIKKAISILFFGRICFIDSKLVSVEKAIFTAIIVLIVRVRTIIFMRPSSNLYFPKTNRERQITRIITVQISMLIKSPNKVEANPAVTMVTAV